MPYTSGALKSQPLGRSGVLNTKCGCWPDQTERLERKQEKLLAIKLQLYNVCIHKEVINHSHKQIFEGSGIGVRGTSGAL